MTIERQSLTTMAILAGILVLLAGAAFLFLRDQNEESYETSPAYQALETPAEVPAYTDVAGTPLDLTPDEPTATVVYSWASWCVQCHEELVSLNAFAGTLGEQVRVLAINRMDNRATANRFLETLPELTNLEIVLDPSDYFFSTVEGYAVPEVLVYDTAGDIQLHDRGVLRPAAIKTALETTE